MQRCLIVVDYQNDFVSGSLGFSDAELLDSLIAKKYNNIVPKVILLYSHLTHMTWQFYIMWGQA